MCYLGLSSCLCVLELENIRNRATENTANIIRHQMAPTRWKKKKREKKVSFVNYMNLSLLKIIMAPEILKLFWNFYILFFIMEYGSRIIYNLGCNAPGMVNSGYKQVISTMMSSLSTLFEVIIEKGWIFQPSLSLFIPHWWGEAPHRYKQTQRYKHIYGQALIKLATRPKFTRNFAWQLLLLMLQILMASTNSVTLYCTFFQVLVRFLTWCTS